MVPGILDRYVFRVFASSYLICATTLLGLFVIGDIFDKLIDFDRGDRPFLEVVAAYYSAQLPLVYYRLGPFMTLAGTLFAVARLERTNELLAMKAAGISIHRALAPIFAGVIGLGAIAALDQELLIPSLADRMRAATAIDRTRAWFEPGILRDRDGSTLFATRYYPSARTLTLVSFRSFHADGREHRAIHVERGRWIAERRSRGYWLLEDGWVRDFPETTPAPGEPSYRERRIGRGLPADLAGGAKGLGGGRAGREPSEREGYPLRISIYPEDIESVEDGEVSSLGRKELRRQAERQDYLPHLRVELHGRFADPLAHVVLCLLGLPFIVGAGGARGGRGIFAGVLAMVLVCLAFFVVSFGSRDLGAKGLIAPALAAWLPVGSFGLLGVFLARRVRT